MEPKTKTDMENFAVKLTDDCPNHEAWLAVVGYGLGTLLENQSLFVEIIFREAMRQVERTGIESQTVSDHARFIFDELGLRLVQP